MKGWNGKILWIDLNRKETKSFEYPKEWAQEYLGGRGLAVRILWEYNPQGVDPFSPENLLIFAIGPLTGLPIPSSGKLQVASKSPLTGGYGDGNIGTMFSVEMRKSGFDAIVFQGRSERPILLNIENDKVSFESAEDLWGLNSWDTEAKLRKRFGRFGGIVEVGNGGENLVRFATIMSQEGRSGGRPGIGAVMGSKKIKAVVIKGTKSIDLYDDKLLKIEGAKALKEVRERPGYNFWMREGTMATIDWAQEESVLPTFNFSEGIFDDFKGIDGYTMESIKVEQRGCPNCNMLCGNVIVDSEGYKSELDYENVAMLGSNIGMAKLKEVGTLNRLADQLGIDAISLGSILGWATEASQRGLLSGIDDRKIEWGDFKTYQDLINEIAFRKTKLGDLLANGTKGACKKIGGCDFAINSKGLEVSAYDCHTAPGMALAFSTSPIGAHHKDAWVISWEVQNDRFSYSKEKAAKVIEMQRIRGGMFESITTCRLPWVEIGLSLEHYPLLLQYATGIKYTWDDIYTIADRIYALIRAFWIREFNEWKREMDMPPEKWFKKPLTKGPLAGGRLSYESFNQLLDYYYDIRGWDKNGVPKKETLKKLNLEFTIPTLEKIIKLS
jgi:aldehyde:ferredoxin oxidoreductase